MGAGLKVCRDCGVEKPLGDFHANRTARWAGRRPECKRCHAIASAERFQRRKAAWRETRARWYGNNLLKADFARSRTRARRAGATEFMSIEEWADLRTQPLCHWCYCVLKRSFTNVDHVLPLAEGGQHTRKNVVLACANCNTDREWQRKTQYCDLTERN